MALDTEVSSMIVVVPNSGKVSGTKLVGFYCVGFVVRLSYDQDDVDRTGGKKSLERQTTLKLWCAFGNMLIEKCLDGSRERLKGMSICDVEWRECHVCLKKVGYHAVLSS